MKDICFDTRTIMVRDGKGAKDRITVLSDVAVEGVRAQLRVTELYHKRDVLDGFPEVYFLAVRALMPDRGAALLNVSPAAKRLLS